MHCAVADGPNHSPGCLPHAVAPCSTNLCIEYGALGSSANKDSIVRSWLMEEPRRQSADSSVFCDQNTTFPKDIPLPIRSMTKEFASKLCPDLIIQPHPVSDVNPPWSTSWLRNRTERDMDDRAFGSCDFAMAGKFDLYVSHILASKSSKKGEGHPPSSPPFPDSSYANPESTLLAVLAALSGGVAACTVCCESAGTCLPSWGGVLGNAGVVVF
jgi:hypothetical protein